jgi:hypothetical protein
MAQIFGRSELFRMPQRLSVACSLLALIGGAGLVGAQRLPWVHAPPAPAVERPRPTAAEARWTSAPTLVTRDRDYRRVDAVVQASDINTVATTEAPPRVPAPVERPGAGATLRADIAFMRGWCRSHAETRAARRLCQMRRGTERRRSRVRVLVGARQDLPPSRAPISSYVSREGVSPHYDLLR